MGMIATLFVGAALCLMSPMTHAFCFDAAGERYGVDPKLLKAIAQVESGMNPSAISRPNSNATFDIGLMQINSAKLPYLERKFNITQQSLINNPCLNTHIGAWVLSEAMNRYGKTWKAVGAYNSGNPQLQYQYVQKVAAVYYGQAAASREGRMAHNSSVNNALLFLADKN
jgi:soluble lytic murein transglycosylase-like protein